MLKERERERASNRGMDNSAGEEGNSQGKADTISSSDPEGDNYCRGTGSRFQYRPEKNRERRNITQQETQLLLDSP